MFITYSTGNHLYCHMRKESQLHKNCNLPIIFLISFHYVESEQVIKRIRTSVANAVTDAILHATEDTELRSSNGKAFAFAFSFAGADVNVAGHGFVPDGGCGMSQDIAEITANGVAIALAGTQQNETGSVAEVRNKIADRIIKDKCSWWSLL